MMRALALVAMLAFAAPALAQEPDALSQQQAAAMARGQELSDLYQDLSADIYAAELKIAPALRTRIDAALATEGEVRRFALDLYEADGATSELDVADGRATAISHYARLLDTVMQASPRDGGTERAVMLRRLAFIEATPLPNTMDGNGAFDCLLWDPLQNSQSIYANYLADPADRALLMAAFTRLEARARRCASSNDALPDIWRQLEVMIGRVHMREKRYAEAYAAGEAAYTAAQREWQAIGMLDSAKNRAGFRMLWRAVRLGQLIAADAAGDAANADRIAADLAIYMREAAEDSNCDGEPACRFFSYESGVSLDPDIGLAGLEAGAGMRPLERLQRAYEKLAPEPADRMKFQLSLAKSLANQPDASLAAAFSSRGVATARANMAKDWAGFGAGLLDYGTDTAITFGGDVAAAQAYYDDLLKAAPADDKAAVLTLRAARMHALGREEEARANYEQALKLAKGRQRFETLMDYGDFLALVLDHPGAAAQYAAWLDKMTPEQDEYVETGVIAWSLAQAMIAQGDAEGARRLAAHWAGRIETPGAPASDTGHERDSEIDTLVRAAGRIEPFDPAGQTAERRCARALWELRKAEFADIEAQIDEAAAKLQGRQRTVPNAADRIRNAERYCPDPGGKFAHRMAVAGAAALITIKDEAGARRALGPVAALHWDDVLLLQTSAAAAGLAALAQDLSAQHDKLLQSMIDDAASDFERDDRRCQRALLDTVAAELVARAGDAERARAGLDAAVKLCDDGDLFASSWFGSIGTAIRIRAGELDAARAEIGPLDELEELPSTYYEAAAREAGATAFADELAAARLAWRQRQRSRF